MASMRLGETASLNVLTPWSGIAAVLGIPCNSQALPAKTTCPCCKGSRLHVYQDTIAGGQWHYCFDCRQAGDMIELASKVWDISPQAAIQKLSCLGFEFPADRLTDTSLNRYVQSYPYQRLKRDAFWEQSCTRFIDVPSATISRLRTKFRLTSQLSRDRWLAGPGRLVGAGTTKDICTTLGRTTTSSDHKVFKGRGWSDVLMLPYYTAPERMAGYLFVGRDGTSADRIWCHSWPHAYPQARRRIELGLSGLHTIEESKMLLGEYVLAVEDPLLMLRLQIRHAASSTVPLPIVSWCDAAGYCTNHTWFAVNNRRVVFWAWQLTPSLVAQARQCDGYIAIIPVNDIQQRTIDHYIRLTSPRDLLRKAVRYALPWQDALVAWAKTASPAAVEELLLGLNAREIDTFDLAHQMSAAVGDAVKVPVRCQVPWDRGAIVEREDGWYFVRTNTRQWLLLAEAKLRIDTIYAGPLTIYSGRILYHDREIPFDLSARSFCNHRRFMIDRCLEEGLGRPKMPMYGNAFSLQEIAIRFQEPRVHVLTLEDMQTGIDNKFPEDTPLGRRLRAAAADELKGAKGEEISDAEDPDA